MATIKETAFDAVDKLEQQLKALSFVTSGLYHISKKGELGEYEYEGCQATIENVIDAIELIKTDLFQAVKADNKGK